MYQLDVRRLHGYGNILAQNNASSQLKYCEKDKHFLWSKTNLTNKVKRRETCQIFSLELDYEQSSGFILKSGQMRDAW